MSCLWVSTVARAESSEPSERTHTLGVGLDAYFDDGAQSIERLNTGGGDLVEGRRDIGNEDEVLGAGLGVALTFLTRVHERFSAGASLRLLGSYSYQLDEDEDEVVELGQLVELSPTAQYLLPITEDLQVAFMGQVGLALVFPAGELADRIEALEAQGFDTSVSPRVGVIGGASVGLRHTYNDWLAFRGDLGWFWQTLFLLNTSAESGGLRGEDNWDVHWTRARLHLGAEVSF